MEKGERVRELRKEKGMTMEQFGAVLGVKKATISLIESCKNNLTDTLFKSICREFSVREEWLRDGTGAMYETGSSGTLDRISTILSGGNAFAARFFDAFSSLDEDEWDLLEKLIEKIASDVKDKVPENDEEHHSEYTPEQLHAELDRQIALEKNRTEKSKVS